MGIGKDIAGWLRSRDTLAVMLDKDDKGAPQIYPRRLPQEAGTRPRAIVYHKISDVSEGSLSGVVRMSNARFQFDCYGRSPDESDAIRDKVKKEFDAFFRGNMGTLRVYGVEHGGDNDDTDEPIDGSDVPRCIAMCDYMITYQRPTE
jgi:hypothetical protein